jgi:hypothetical protein
MIKPILASLKSLDPKKYEKAISDTLDMLAENVLVDFKVTTRTWSTQPDFVKEKDPGVRRVYTTNLIYKFVSGGTRVRYATMSPGFIAKTKTGVIGSTAGKGGMMFVSRKFPRPGIEARKFDVAIRDKWIKRTPALLQRAIVSEASHA